MEAPPLHPRERPCGIGRPMAPSEYEKYIRTEGLLSLQKSAEELSCHDEMQFQIVHQAAELWMKLIEFEVRHMADLLAEDRLALATSTLRRTSRILRLVTLQLDLLDTMSPKAY